MLYMPLFYMSPLHVRSALYFFSCSTYSRNSLVPCSDCFVLFTLVLIVVSIAPMSLVLYLARLVLCTRLTLFFHFVYCFSCSFTVSHGLWAHVYKSRGLGTYSLSFLLSLIKSLVVCEPLHSIPCQALLLKCLPRSAPQSPPLLRFTPLFNPLSDLTLW
jgi:hypothetical protein